MSAGLLDHHGAFLAARDAAWREGYRIGFLAGIEVGRGAALAEEAQQRREAAGVVREATRGPSHAAVLARRWTVRGERRTRETFGQPHPGDFTGRDGAT